MLGLMFALARMASAAWVGAAVLFVVVAVTQTRHFRPLPTESAAVAETNSTPENKSPASDAATNAATEPAVTKDQNTEGKAADNVATTTPASEATDANAPVAEARLARHLELDSDQRAHVVAELALTRFPLYYLAGAILLGTALFSSAFLRRRYLKPSRWALVMLFLATAGGLMAYDFISVYRPLERITKKIAVNPERAVESEFTTLHEHSKEVNSAEIVLTFLASLLLCLPGTRPEAPFLMVKEKK